LLRSEFSDIVLGVFATVVAAYSHPNRYPSRIVGNADVNLGWVNEHYRAKWNKTFGTA
jgi:hypothetical protein